MSRPTNEELASEHKDGTTDLSDEVESDGLVGEAAPHPSISTLLPSLCVGIRLEHFV